MKQLLVLAVAAAFLTAVSCQVIAPPGAPSKPSVVAHGESIEITWNAVADTGSYTLFYTTDSSDPTSATQSTVTGITGTTYVHQNLDPTKLHKYAVCALGTNGAASALSAASDGLKPNPLLHLTVTFPGYTNGKAAAMLLDVPYDPVSNSVTGSTTLMQIATAATDAAGTASFTLEMDHTKYWGYTVFKDTDASGSLTSGDIVWGPSGLGYRYWDVLQEGSFGVTIPDWDTNFATTPSTHTF